MALIHENREICLFHVSVSGGFHVKQQDFVCTQGGREVS